MIEIPYKIASRRPLRLSFERFRKKLTVMGMIGHTQGVKRATKPPNNPKIKIIQSEVSLVFISLLKACSSLITGVYKSFELVVDEMMVAVSAAVVCKGITSVTTLFPVGVLVIGVAFVACTSLLLLNSNGILAGDKQVSPLQPINSTKPAM